MKIEFKIATLQIVEYIKSMDNIYEIFAKNLISLRKKKKLTQLELANKLNYSDKNISKWENAQALPTTEVMYELALFFDVSIDYLLKEHSEKEIDEDQHKQISSIRNKIIIVGLCCLCVQLLAIISFISFPSHFNMSWMAFIYSLPVMSIILIVFVSLWFKKKPFLFISVSLLVWTLMLSIYLSLYIYLNKNFWFLFLVGIPLQLAVFLSSGFNIRKKN